MILAQSLNCARSTNYAKENFKSVARALPDSPALQSDAILLTMKNHIF